MCLCTADYARRMFCRFEQANVQTFVRGLLEGEGDASLPDSEKAHEEEDGVAGGDWQMAILCAVELLCVSWNAKPSLCPLLEALLEHSLLPPASVLRWHGPGRRAMLRETSQRGSAVLFPPTTVFSGSPLRRVAT